MCPIGMIDWTGKHNKKQSVAYGIWNAFEQTKTARHWLRSSAAPRLHELLSQMGERLSIMDVRHSRNNETNRVVSSEEHIKID